MDPEPEHLLVLSTCPGSITAKKIAQTLVESGCAACVNILPAHSIFWWKGRIESADEHVLLIKTRIDRYHEVERTILAQHPYELPEVIAVPIKAGLMGYLSWIDDVLRAS
ncbi:MAG: divalent-cation tolerance protein CutA [Gammaproteobacteria bacterium]|nr:divalent-cation tolerance protein CutA [Gammaproteobacteria bacterium]MCI0591442.1 divalent-cation tolerance protein CutA [Gammaproteobacteria bacterium]